MIERQFAFVGLRAVVALVTVFDQHGTNPGFKVFQLFGSRRFGRKNGLPVDRQDADGCQEKM